VFCFQQKGFREQQRLVDDLYFSPSSADPFSSCCGKELRQRRRRVEKKTPGHWPGEAPGRVQPPNSRARHSTSTQRPRLQSIARTHSLTMVVAFLPHIMALYVFLWLRWRGGGRRQDRRWGEADVVLVLVRRRAEPPPPAGTGIHADHLCVHTPVPRFLGKQGCCLARACGRLCCVVSCRACTDPVLACVALPSVHAHHARLDRLIPTVTQATNQIENN